MFHQLSPNPPFGISVVQVFWSNQVRSAMQICDDKLLTGTRSIALVWYCSSLFGMCFNIVAYTLGDRFCRYSSIVVIVVSNVGFFYPQFTPDSCAHYFYVIPIFKGWCHHTLFERSGSRISPEIQLMVSQATLGIRWVLIDLYVHPSLTMSPRTYSIALHSLWVGRIVLSSLWGSVVIVPDLQILMLINEDSSSGYLP